MTTSLRALMPADSAGYRFNTRYEQKENGKKRRIDEPTALLKALHHELLGILEEVVGKPKLSAVSNLLAHGTNRYFYQLDIKDAFPSVKAERLAGLLYHRSPTLGTYEEIVAFLKRYCMVEPQGLAQGAPASPLLFELYSGHHIDAKVTALLAWLSKRGFPPIRYTRYVDDITFSSHEPLPKRLQRQVKKIVREAGFAVHPNKVLFGERGVDPIVITGGTLPPGRPATLKPAFYRRLEHQLDLLFDHKVVHPALRGSIAWHLELEQRVEGGLRNRQVHRLNKKVAAAQEALAAIRLSRQQTTGKRYRLPKPWLDELKQQMDLVAYARKIIPGQWSPLASGIKSRCPFCHHKHKSFTASGRLKTFHCFACKAHGDVIQFVRLLKHLDFMTAALYLAAEAQMELPREYYHRFGKVTSTIAVQLDLFTQTDKR